MRLRSRKRRSVQGWGPSSRAALSPETNSTSAAFDSGSSPVPLCPGTSDSSVCAVGTNSRMARSSGGRRTVASVVLLLLVVVVRSTWDVVSARGFDVSYSDLEDANARCDPLDSCRLRRTEDSLRPFNCHCGPYCAKYDTCCLDSPFRRWRPSGKTPHECANVFSFGSVYLVNRCAPDWTGDPHVREMCAGDGHLEGDLLLLVPFTAAATRVTYKNSFCAVCNGEAARGKFWNVRLTIFHPDFNRTISGVPDLAFDPDEATWRLSDHPERPKVYVSVERPDGVSSHLCYRDIVSRCADDWPRDDVSRDGCSSYTATIWVRVDNYTSTRYRNVHCALCNGERDFEALCREPPGSGAFGGGMGGGGISFAHLMDVNPSDGDRVGEVRRCAANEMYDPFAKRCRPLRCAIPGRVVRNGSCVRQ